MKAGPMGEGSPTTEFPNVERVERQRWRSQDALDFCATRMIDLNLLCRRERW
jgi:hypothetical protein